jgi:hypothetical protein
MYIHVYLQNYSPGRDKAKTQCLARDTLDRQIWFIAIPFSYFLFFFSFFFSFFILNDELRIKLSSRARGNYPLLIRQYPSPPLRGLSSYRRMRTRPRAGIPRSAERNYANANLFLYRCAATDGTKEDGNAIHLQTSTQHYRCTRAHTYLPGLI